MSTQLRSSPLFILLFCPVLAFGQTQPELKPIPDLKPASEYPRDKIEAITKLAYQHWPFLAEEGPHVAGSFKTIRAVPGFSQRDDLIWEVRIIHMLRTPSGILWINERTKEVIILGKQK